MARPSSPSEPTLIQRQAEVRDLCTRCRDQGRFAFDTEFVMEDRYESDVCLIQIATREGVTIIDPHMGLDLAEVWALVGDAEVEVIVHAGQEDLALAVQHCGQVPRRVFDVQIAAGLVGLDYPISLQRLVQAIMHIRLHKSKTLTDWRRRPLSEAQIRYAAEDVVHLLDIHEKLRNRLSKLGRPAWARAEFERFEDLTLYRRAEEEKVSRVKGAGALTGRQLATVRELIAWREKFAQRVNRPVRAVLKDHLLVEIAKHGLTEYAEIRSLRGLNLADRDIHAVARVVKKALAIPSEEWPKPKPRDQETPEEASLVALITAVIRGYCLENRLAYGLVATQKSIRSLVRARLKVETGGEEDLDLLTGWRGESIGGMVGDVLAGRRAVRIEEHNGTPVVRVGDVN